MSVLNCTDLVLGYEGHAVVSGLSFSVNEGDYLCIVGENGSGKSTLIKTVLGLNRPISGTVEFGDGVRSIDIGYLPQQTQIQRDFPASVYEIVLSGCEGNRGLRPFYTKADKTRVADAMELMNITALSKRCYRELSGGQQQRVLLARALCAADRLLLLDEPVAGLDPKVTADMYALIEDLNKNRGMSIIMVSHDIEAALRYATHILHIGKKTFFGTVPEYLESEAGKSFTVNGGERND